MAVAKKSSKGYRGYASPLGIFLFLFPALLGYTVFTVLPIGVQFVYSLLKWKGYTPLLQFNNFYYYSIMFQDKYFWRSIINNGRVWILGAFIEIPIALLLAFVLSRRVRGVGFFRVLYYIPQIIPVLFLAMIFKFLIIQEYGLNGLLRAVGLGNFIQPWLSKDGLSQWVIGIPGTWQGVGFWIVIFIAAIAGVSEELFEAAQLDGANDMQLLRYITLPGIRSVVVFAYIMLGLGAIQSFMWQFLIPSAPGAPMGQNHTLGSYIAELAMSYRSTSNLGYASTLSVSLFVISVVATVIVWRVNQWSQER